jgi:hypothetical protein
MKVGDMVRHRFEGCWDEVGVVWKIAQCIGVPGGMAYVLWNVEQTHRNNNNYRVLNLEVINNGCI